MDHRHVEVVPAEVCEPPGAARFQEEICYSDMMKKLKTEIRILDAKLHFHVLEQETSHDTFKGLSDIHQKEKQLFLAYAEHHCDTYVQTLNGGLGTGLGVMNNKCMVEQLDQRVQTLSDFIADFD